MQHTLRRCLAVATTRKYTSKLRCFATLPTAPEPNKRQASPNQLPRLMDFPEIIWPSALNTIKNWITVQFIIRPYFDSEFQIKDFIYGAKQALQVR